MIEVKILVLKRTDASYEKARELRDIPEHLSVDFMMLDKAQQCNLKEALKDTDLSQYDRIVFRLKFHHIKYQTPYIASLKNVVIIELDSFGNFMLQSRFTEFEYFFHHMPHHKFLVTGWYPRDRFIEQGLLDTHFISKSYNDHVLDNLGTQRDIEYGFVGTLHVNIYKGRRKILQEFSRHVDLKANTTSSMEEYNALLNRITYFISADVGFKEYMIKNFEAMACGCVLVAYRVGGEEEHLGFKDMHNVILYSTVQEALDKINYVNAQEGMKEEIAARGQKLVEERFTDTRRNELLYEAVTQPFVPFHYDNRSKGRKLVCFIINNPASRKLLRSGNLLKRKLKRK